MRDAFAQELTAIVQQRDDVVLLSGDIGNRMFDKLRTARPKQFYNCGIAEAGMMSLAAGLGMTGLRPVIYTITPFVTTRCLEQVKVGICYHEAPAIIVGTGAGLSYAQLGPTHHSLEDIAIMRSLPDMVVCCPADAMEVRASLRYALTQRKPVYIRLGKKGEKVFHEAPPVDFAFGKALPIATGEDIALLSCGNMLPLAEAVRARLQDQGISASLSSFHTVKPLDEAFLSRALHRYKLVVTLEEHNGMGGFYSAVSEFVIRHHPALASKIHAFHTEDRFYSRATGQDNIRRLAGLDETSIADDILTRLQA